MACWRPAAEHQTPSSSTCLHWLSVCLTGANSTLLSSASSPHIPRPPRVFLRSSTTSLAFDKEALLVSRSTTNPPLTSWRTCPHSQHQTFLPTPPSQARANRHKHQNHQNHRNTLLRPSPVSARLRSTVFRPVVSPAKREGIRLHLRHALPATRYIPSDVSPSRGPTLTKTFTRALFYHACNSQATFAQTAAQSCILPRLPAGVDAIRSLGTAIPPHL